MGSASPFAVQVCWLSGRVGKIYLAMGSDSANCCSSLLVVWQSWENIFCNGEWLCQLLFKFVGCLAELGKYFLQWGVTLPIAVQVWLLVVWQSWVNIFCNGECHCHLLHFAFSAASAWTVTWHLTVLPRVKSVPPTLSCQCGLCCPWKK